ncbi:fumarylacetoacetate hydrolase family protein [Streptomyces sp. NPDC057557]|uniref:fumarylacetoacetate hydrolase family protein n=1 Tax=Streptomyces sp. NPDC057557 TaxID=3346167 RepID=UPI003682269C
MPPDVNPFVRMRHHWKPAAALGVGLAAMVAFIGDARISPYVTSSSRVEADAITDNAQGTDDLYDTAVPLLIQLNYQQNDFDKMMKEFREDGTKDYIEVDLTATLDGRLLQKANTSELYFDVATLIAHASTLTPLRPGDLITTGTPGGTHDHSLVPGQNLNVAIKGLGCIDADFTTIAAAHTSESRSEHVLL